MSVKGTHSVLELLASYQANASESGSPPVSRFAAARLEREQSRLARHAAAGVGAEEEEVSGIEELVPPRLRVKPPLSTGQGTYSPTVPGTPNEVVSSPASAAKLGDTADLSASPRGSAKSQYVSKESDSVKSTNRGGSPVSEIPPFNPARSRSRPSSPTPSASSAQSFTTQATDAIVPMDLMARLRQKQKQQAAHHAHLATSPPTIAALPPRSPELVPLPSEAHEFHPVSPITERTEVATLSSARRSYNASQSGAPSFRSSVGTFPSHRWSAQTDPRPSSILDSIKEGSDSSGRGHPAASASLPADSPDVTATPPRSRRHPISVSRDAGTSAQANPELYSSLPLLGGSNRSSPAPLSTASASGLSTERVAPAGSPPHNRAGPLCRPGQSRPHEDLAQYNTCGHRAAAAKEPRVVDVGRVVPAGWEALKREMEEEKIIQAKVDVVSASGRTETSEAGPGASSSRGASRTSFVLSTRTPSEAGVEPEFHSAKASPLAEGAILFEGPLLVPPADSTSATEALAGPVSGWAERYAVLTDTVLEARPTDRGGTMRTEVLLTMAECTKVANLDRPGIGLRAFVVQTVRGRTSVFATETRIKRANWVLAIENAIAGAKLGGSSSSRTTRSSASLSSPRNTSQLNLQHTAAFGQEAAMSPLKGAHRSVSPFFSGNSPLPPPDHATSSRPFPFQSVSTQTSPKAQPAPQPSTHTRATGQSSLFGAANEFPPRVLWSGEAVDEAGEGEAVWDQLAGAAAPARDLFGHVRGRREAVEGSVAPLRVGKGAPRVAESSWVEKGGFSGGAGLGGMTVPVGVESQEIEGGSKRRGRGGERRRLPPLASVRGPVPAGIFRDLVEVTDVILGSLGQGLLQHRPATLASRLHILLNAILVKLASHNGSTVAGSSKTSTGRLKWIEDLLGPVLDSLVARNQVGRDPSLIRAAIGDALDVLHGIVHQAEQAQRPILSPRPQRVLDVDQITQTTTRMIHDADEADEWNEFRRSFETDAAEARAQVAPSFQRSPTSWAHDVRFAERKPSGKNPNVPLTTKDSSHFQQQRQAPLESARAGGGWGSNIGRAPASERTAGREGRRGPLPSTPHEAAEVADGWARMGDGSRWTESESLKGSVMGAETASIATSDKLRAMRKMDPSELLAMLVLNNQKLERHMAASSARELRMDSFFNGLTDFLAQGQARSDAQHAALVETMDGAVAQLGPTLTEALAEDVYRRMHDLPSRAEEEAELEAERKATEAAEGLRGGAPAEDTDGDTMVGSDLSAGVGGDGGARREPGLVGFAEVEERMTGTGKLKKAWSRANVKGPRSFKLWGISGSGVAGTSNWANALATRPAPAPPPPPPKHEGQTEEEYALVRQKHVEQAEAALAKAHEPLIEKIRTDEGLAQTLETLANGEGDIDAGSMALAVFEILQSMRDVHKRQAQKEAAEAEERLANGGLSKKEVALLEMKKDELARLEALTEAEHHTTSKLDVLATALDQKQAAHDAILAQIASEIKAEKQAGMDPALVQEGKVLLEKVKSGVDGHIREFRGQLTGEVQRMFKEVGKLREEKQNLQREIADLMAFHAKQGGHGGGGGGAAKGPPKAAPASAPAPAVKAEAAHAADEAPKSPTPGVAVGGWFGPRAPK